MKTYARPSCSGGAEDRPAPAILVVEDSPIIQATARALLLNLGFSADLADDGLAAVARATTRRYDVIFMDMHMPVLDGPAASREICARCGEQRPWIVAMTASMMPHDRRECLDAGMDEFLLKPLTAGKFAAVLARFGPPTVAPGAADETTAATPAAELAAVHVLLAAMAAGDPARFVESREMLLVSLERGYTGLAQAFAAGDRRQAHRWAHSLAGTTMTTGLRRVGLLAATIERDCAAPRPLAPAVATFAALVPLWADTLAAVRGLAA